MGDGGEFLFAKPPRRCTQGERGALRIVTEIPTARDCKEIRQIDGYFLPLSPRIILDNCRMSRFISIKSACRRFWILAARFFAFSSED